MRGAVCGNNTFMVSAGGGGGCPLDTYQVLVSYGVYGQSRLLAAINNVLNIQVMMAGWI